MKVNGERAADGLPILDLEAFVRVLVQGGMPEGTHFTCSTGTKVQRLTHKAPQV
jgi:hypothetical protein